MTLHERQIRFFTILFASLIIVVLMALLWLVNRSPITGP
jgi:hypothetical protein